MLFLDFDHGTGAWIVTNRAGRVVFTSIYRETAEAYIRANA